MGTVMVSTFRPRMDITSGANAGRLRGHQLEDQLTADSALDLKEFLAQ